MKLLPPQKTASVTKFSSLSRTQIATFFSKLSAVKVHKSTIVKISNLLGFDNHLPIPLSQVQRIYLIACAKELINGGRSSYREAMLTCNLTRQHSNADLLEAWSLMHSMGSLSKTEFDNRLTEFYAKSQIDR